MLLMYIAGNVFSYFTTPKVMLALPIAFIILFYFFPETPIYLIRLGKMQEAEMSLKFLRGYKARDELSEDLRNELEKMIRKVNDDVRNKLNSKLSGLRKLN